MLKLKKYLRNYEVISMYFAIIGDIVESKKILNRNEAQEKLNHILKDINIEYERNIAAKFIITLGDEFQGLLSNPIHLFDIIDKIKFKMYPIKIRFGVGIGNIHTNINKEMALGADGPAYHYARKMIEEIKILNKTNSKSQYNTDIGVSSIYKTDIVSLINNNLCLCYFIEEKWTDKQRELIEKIMFSNKTQREIANELNLVQSSVQRRLKSSGYYNYIYVKHSLNRVLMEVWGEYKYAD